MNLIMLLLKTVQQHSDLKETYTRTYIHTYIHTGNIVFALTHSFITLNLELNLARDILGVGDNRQHYCSKGRL